MSNEGSFFNVSELERESMAKENYPDSVLKKHEKANIVLNCVVAAFACWLFDRNIILVGLSFIGFDMFLGFVDNIIFNIIPQIHNNMSLEDRQKYVENLEKKCETLKKQLKEYHKKNCQNCPEFYNDKCLAYHPCSKVKDTKFWIRRYKEEKKKLDEQLEAAVEEKVVNKNKQSKDYSDKLEYFKDMKALLNVFISKKDMSFLLPIKESISKLLKVLNKKPIGYTMIPNTLYIYLDELSSILNKLVTIDSNKKEVYLQQVEKIAKELSESIDSLNRRIQNFEEEDIEVGLNVLLQELVREKNEREESKDV